jgi:hypothetical protein
MSHSYLQPPGALVMGTPGSGKTDALATLIEADLDLFVIVTEPDGISSLIDSCDRRKLPIDRLHWVTCLPATPGWSALQDMVKTLGTMGFEQIQNIKSGVGKEMTRVPADKLIKSFANFHCERTDKDFGPVDKWGPDRALAFDSLSGLNLISWMLGVGYKPAAHQGEWGMTMNFIEQVLLKLTSDRNSFFVLNAHLEREPNELTGATQMMVSTLGKKLAPKIPRFFSEVVLARRTLKNNTASFTWSTADSMADLKNRSLPIGTELSQSFVPIVKAYRRRLELATPSPQSGKTLSAAS